MKVLHFLWGLSNGGAENLAVDLANQQARDHEVTLLVGNDCVDPSVRRQLDPVVRFIHLGRPEGSRNPYWIARLLLTIRKARPDVIHSHSRDFALLSKFIRRPMVLTVHDMNLDLSGSVSAYDRICCISEAVFADMRDRYPELNPHRIDNGIVVSRIATNPNRLRPTVLRGVQVSRLVHDKKGQDLLLRALKTVNGNRDEPRLLFDFIGDGPSLSYLKDLAETLGVASQCNFLGALSRDDVYSRLCNYDLLVQPSRYEGFGLTVAEGMAAGIPVIVSDIEGPMEIIGKGQHGHYFTSDDPISLATSIESLISDINSGASQQRCVIAQRYVEEKYGLQRTSQQYCDIYRDAITSFGQSR